MRVTALVVAIFAFDIKVNGFLVSWSTTSFGVNPSFASSTRLRTSVEEADEEPAASKLGQHELAKNINKKENHDLFFESSSFDGTRPESAFFLAFDNFIRQGSSIMEVLAASVGITGKSYIPVNQMPPECLGLSLDDEAVREAERKREALPGGKVVTNPVSQKLYDVGCYALDELFPGRPIARFWFLEVIARMPYFSYVSMLHLYESLGWWREPELRKIHNAQEYNELHHLLIMESLGGNMRWRDRFLGSHVAIGYYWAVNALFFFSPKAAYEFMELLESHAVDTYTTFCIENEERLKKLPAPRVAISYYKADDLYLFDDFQVSKKPKSRRPPCDTLYDVFKNIAEDEAEHVKTMQSCKDYAAVGNIVVSPHLNAGTGESIISEEQRQAWLDWSEEINRASTGEEDF